MSIGTVSELIQYFNLHPQIFEKERNHKEHMERIMSILSQQNMEILQNEFELYPKGLELPTFIYLMKKLYTPQNQISKYYFVGDLIKFFQAIDINGDGHLEWSEFTEYIIENIRQGDTPKYKDKNFQQNQVISSAYSKVSNQYAITNLVDINSTGIIKKVKYIYKEQQYLIQEQSSNYIRFYDNKFTLIDFLELKGQSQHSFIVDFAFDQDSAIICCIFQNSARFTNLKIPSNVKMSNTCQINKISNFHRLQYLPLHKMWAFLSKSGDLKLSSAIYLSRTNLEYQSIATLKLHQAMITDVCEIEDPLYLLTSGMDGEVKFYSFSLKKVLPLEPISEHTSSAIDPKYRKGILGVNFSRQFGNYILTYGFSSGVYVYCLDISLTKGFTGQYKDHAGTLIAAKFLKTVPYIVSLDQKLHLRIWDFRKFQTVQIMNCEKHFINPMGLEINTQFSQCFIWEKKIAQLRAPSLQKKSKEINEFHSILDFKICPFSNNLFLFTSNDVRVYNYFTGSVQKIFSRLSESTYETNITAYEFGYKCRKFFVGDAAGLVREYCSQTGEFLQAIAPPKDNNYQNKSIVKLIFLKEHSLFIVCTLDGRVLIYSRNSQSQFVLIRDFRDTHFQLTAAEASVRYCLLATGGECGLVNLWNLQKLSHQGYLWLQSKVTHIFFSPIYPIAIIVQSLGIISFFYVRPYQDLQMRNHCFLKINNIQRGQLRPIPSISFQLVINAYMKKNHSLTKESPEDHYLVCVIGGQNGVCKIVNMTQILRQYQITQNHQIFTPKKALKCEIISMKNLKKKVATTPDQPDVTSLEQFSNSLQFQTHKQCVDRLCFIKELGIVLTASNKEKVMKLWNIDGGLNGAIDFFTFKKTTWKVSEINFHKKMQEIETTIYSVKLIEGKQLRPEEEEFIKVNLLINQFMNQEEKQYYLQWINILRRKRSKVKRISKKVEWKHEDDMDDICIDKIKDRSEERQGESPFVSINQAQFNDIYSKLKTKIISQIGKQKLPTLPNLDKGLKIESLISQPQIDLVTVLRKTLRNELEQEKKIQQRFLKIPTKPTATKQKANFLYNSLTNVKRNIAIIEKKVKAKRVY